MNWVPFGFLYFGLLLTLAVSPFLVGVGVLLVIIGAALSLRAYARPRLIARRRRRRNQRRLGLR